jgi:hypothetical protein
VSHVIRLRRLTSSSDTSFGHARCARHRRARDARCARQLRLPACRAQSGTLLVAAQMLVGERKDVTRCAADNLGDAGSRREQKRAVPGSHEPRLLHVRDCGSVECQPASGWRSRASGRLRKSERRRRRAAADYCFQRSCLQSNGSQLAIGAVLLLANTRARSSAPKTPASVGPRYSGRPSSKRSSSFQREATAGLGGVDRGPISASFVDPGCLGSRTAGDVGWLTCSVRA